jgi:type III restriction enzyme
MKLKFKNQPFQTDAVEAVADLFAGQEKQQSTFAITQDDQTSLLQNEYGLGNAQLIDDADLLRNMQSIQKRRNLPQTSSLEGKQFCVEMETGTGKTYVYSKTIYELNKRYGFVKFIIVVPSVAIREGVYKSLQITREHFANQYDGAPCRFFIYNSAKLSEVRQFATSANIEIMIINIDAFRKSENVINQAQDRLGGETAMRFIRDTNPIVIIDEPQSVDTTPKAKEAIASLNPLCVLRYSATHREKINLLYRLTPVDAYQMGIVKQICVSSSQAASGFNKPYIRLLSASSEGGFKARLEIDALGKNGKVSRKAVTIRPGDDLFLLSGQRDLYDGYTITGIDCTPEQESVEFANTETVGLGQAIGDIDENQLKRAQIRRTIEAHLEKELRYTEKGIKVLSLFFIDRVEKYRTADGQKGVYANMFEEAYAELMALPKFEKLRSRFPTSAEQVHNGYFSQDKKGKYKNTRGDTLDDTDTYSVIMKDKEWLLSFDCPLRFIFSHSALKEGWDNPNVFQVCTLLDQRSTFSCRQKIGRGLRLCVDQDGNRIEDKNINILHVMATESFAEFAETLQKEIETETGVQFGVLQISLFSGMAYEEKHDVEKNVTPEQANHLFAQLETQGYVKPSGQITSKLKEALAQNQMEVAQEFAPILPKITELVEQKEDVEEDVALAPDILTNLTYTETVIEEKTVSYEEATELMTHFKQKGYITKSGKMKDTMKNDLLNGTLDLPQKFEAARDRFENIISKADTKPPLRDASRDVLVRLNKQVMLSPEFMELWEKIRQKTTYRVQVDTDELIRRCVKDLQALPPIPKARIISQTAELDIQDSGVTHTEREMRTTEIQNSYEALPDILDFISEEALITPATVRDIIVQSGRGKDFLNNPQAFLEKALDIIRDNRHALAIDGIKYQKLAGQEYAVQEIFDAAELLANLDKNAVPVQHSVYDHIIYDSGSVEKPFALALDNDPDVRMFVKLPSRFRVDTPIGSYNPDWAVYFEKDGVQKLFFVLETKGSTSLYDLRTTEQLKIHCGQEHFRALGNGVEMRVANSWDGFKREL